MKNLIPVLIVMLALSACTDKVYTYRKMIRVGKNTADAATLPVSKKEKSMQAQNTSCTEMTADAENGRPDDTEEVSASAGISKPVFTTAQKGIEKYRVSGEFSPVKQLAVNKKSAKEQVKKAVASIDGLGGYSQPVRLMIIGLIVVLAGIILGIITGPLGGIVYSIGAIIFLIGLILFLVDLL